VSITLRAGGATDVGRLRNINQDSYVLIPERGLFIVADGMGGHQGGEVASRLAIETIQLAYQEATAEALQDALEVANHRIHIQAADDPDLKGMGTTVVAAALLEDGGTSEGSDDAQASQHLLIANVGDSRAYLFRDGDLTQLTDDHSLVADLVREGRITREEAEVHPQRNIVTRVLGVYEQVEVDLWPLDPVRGDRVLLCSDGLFNEVGEDQIGSVLRRLDDPTEAAEELVRLANAGGGRDNITVVVLDVVDDGGVAEQASAALASSTSSLQSERDLAGFTTALAPDEEPSPPPSPTRRQRRAERREARKRDRASRSRLSWRAVLFTVLVLGVLGGAIATIQWYGSSTYFVGFDGDEVAVYKGRPGGLLWIDPTIEEGTGIQRDEVPSRYLGSLESGREFAERWEADRFVSNIERDINDAHDAEAQSTTTTTRPATTTTSTTAAPGAG